MTTKVLEEALDALRSIRDYQGQPWAEERVDQAIISVSEELSKLKGVEPYDEERFWKSRVRFLIALELSVVAIAGLILVVILQTTKGAL